MKGGENDKKRGRKARSRRFSAFKKGVRRFQQTSFSKGP
jgi:hypothetical protein